MSRAHPVRNGVVGALLLVATQSPGISGQSRWQDLVITVGGSVEGYSGNFSAVTVPIVDSTDHATATIGEVGARGVLSLLSSNRSSLTFSFDGGVRQTAAMGFRFRDYAPREWVGAANLHGTRRLSEWGTLSVRGGLRGRVVRDRPPMPLFLQPGYGATRASVGLVTRSFDGISLDATADLDRTNYKAPDLLPQLDLLDRNSYGGEAGARWGGASTMRVYAGVRWTQYPNQPSYDPTDPFRRDRTARVGIEWTYAGSVFAQAGLDGALNRSNSNRPEYDALSFRGLITTPLPGSMSLSLYALLTTKSYVAATSFARLVPGEEADNASIAYLQVSRLIATNLDGAFRLGWTRAETDIGSAYYQRFGASFQLNYRPLIR